MLDRIESLVREHKELEGRIADPAIVADQKKFVKLSRRYADLTDIVKLGTTLRERHEDVETLTEMIDEVSGDEADELRNEQTQTKQQIDKLEEELKLLLLPKDPNAGRNVIMEIRGAEGGEEANLFARDLYEMYRSYASAQGWGFEPLGSKASDMGGFSEVTFMLKGNNVWTRMKFEAGPHRVQRVPSTESQGRVHTSSSTVTVLPEADEIDIEVNHNELRFDTYRSSGSGGQHVNTTDSAVRITHLPTGLVVSMQDEKSQLQNREKALKVLRSRLLKQEQDKQRIEASEARKGQTGSGGRSEKIRTYNFKESRVTDHRLGLTLHKLDRVLAGELDDISDALVQDERTRQLQAESS